MQSETLNKVIIMGRNCEFCGDPRPIIYCKADAACLCLPCDAKVHSANALSSRHPRTLLCEACGDRPSVARCLDHCMFICRRCDKSLHESSSQHCKQTLSIYTGCPSASDFAMLWGYDLKDLPGNRSLYPLSSKTFHPILHVTKNGNNHGQSSSGTEESTLTFSDSIKNIVENKLPDCDTVLQQILELERLQLNEGDRNCSLLHDKVQREEFEGHTLKNPSDSLYQGFGIDLPKHDGSHHQLDIQHFELIFSQSRQLGSPLDSEFSSHGETFGQCKTSESSSQNWDQGMQDLGFCEDSECYGDLDMPDVDLTFCNYEEIFENDEEREELASHNFTVSSKEHDASLYKPDREHPSLIEDV